MDTLRGGSCSVYCKMDPTCPLICPDGVLRLLKVGKPDVLFFAAAVKINDHYRAQKRFIALTKSSFYNIKQGFLFGYTIKREISIDYLQGLIRNPTTNEFVLKVNASIPNDYRYRGTCWQGLTEVLLGLNQRISVWTISTALDDFVKRKGDAVASRERGSLRFRERSSGGKTEETGFSCCSLSIADENTLR